MVLFIIYYFKQMCLQSSTGKTYDILPEDDETEETIVVPIQSEIPGETNKDLLPKKSGKKKKKSKELKKKKKKKRRLSVSSSNVSFNNYNNVFFFILNNLIC